MVSGKLAAAVMLLVFSGARRRTVTATKTPAGTPAVDPIVPVPAAVSGALPLPVPRYDANVGGAPATWTNIVGTDGPDGTAATVVRDPLRAWADLRAALEWYAAADRWAEAKDATWAPVRVLDVSREGGGALGTHKSHRHGRDFDVGWGGPMPMQPLAELLFALLQSRAVGTIFLSTPVQAELFAWLVAHPTVAPGLVAELQYPDAAGTSTARVRHASGHEHHLHVRWRP